MSIQFSLVLFTALTGIGGWLFACVAVNEFTGKVKGVDFIASAIAFALMAIGGICSVTHLSHPDRMLAAFSHPTSGIFVEAVLVFLAAACIAIYMILLKREISARKALAALGAVVGVALSFMAGFSYIMPAIPAWDTVLLPVAYMATAIPAGAALYALLAVIKKEEDVALFGTVILAGGVLAAISAAGFLIGANANPLIGWGASVLVGGAVPAVCGWFVMKKKQTQAAIYAALACATIGCIAFRCAMWMSGVSLYNLFGVVF